MVNIVLAEIALFIVEKLHNPGRKNMAAMPWSCYDHTIIPWSWRSMVMIIAWWQHVGHFSWHSRHDSWHDHWMITIFPMIHTMIGMIVMFSMFFLKKMDCLSLFFFQIVAAIYHYVAQLTGLRWNYASKVSIQPNWTKITPKSDFSSVITRQQFLFNNSFNRTYILQLFASNFWKRDSL